MERTNVLPYVSATLTAFAGLAWLVQGFLPLGGGGLFRSTGALDLARFAHGGPLSTVLPGQLVLILLVVPLAGCALVALSPFSGAAVLMGRAVAVVLGGAVVMLQVLAVLGVTSSGLGAGAWCAVAGLLLGVAGVLVGLVALLVAGEARRTGQVAAVPHMQSNAPSTLINQENP